MNVKLSNSQLNKLKPAIKNGADVILRLSSNVIGNSDDETNFPHKLLLTNRQFANLRKAFANHTSTDVKLSKAQLTKIAKRRVFKIFNTIIKIRIAFIKICNYTLGCARSNCCWISNRCKNKHKIIGSGNHTTLIISNDDMQDLLKRVKSLEDSGLLLDGITRTVKNEVK